MLSMGSAAFTDWDETHNVNSIQHKAITVSIPFILLFVLNIEYPNLDPKIALLGVVFTFYNVITNRGKNMYNNSTLLIDPDTGEEFTDFIKRLTQ